MSGAPAVLRLSLASLRTHRRRFVGTFAAVLLGVAFLSGTLVMGDTLRASFDTLFRDATGSTDAVIRSAEVIESGGRGQPAGTRASVDAALAERVAEAPQVARAVPSIEAAGQLQGADGEPVGGQGPPTLAGNWIDDPALNPYQLDEGRAPRASGEAVINRGAAEAGGLEIGDTTTLSTPDPVTVRIVGLATFGGEDGMGQTTFTGLTLADAERHLATRPGQAASIQVRAEDGTSQNDLVAALTGLLPDGVEAVTGEEVASESQEAISGTFLALFTTLLLVFSGIAMLVAVFSIHNTFAIVVAQRTRENALLRALGADRRQVLAATLAEAAVVGVVASLVGLLGGIGIALGLQSLFPAVGFPFPTGVLVISAVSVLLPLAVGVVVCLASALFPALRAGRTSPLAALREVEVESSDTSRLRTASGVLLGAGGAALATLGAVGDRSAVLTAVGAVGVLAAFLALGPVAAGLAVRALGGPLGRLRGVTGRLAQRNALRSPRRTASTAAALMIGVAVVTVFTVFAASLKATMDQTVARSFAGDLAVSTSSFGAGGSGISPRLAPALAELPEVETALGLGQGVARVDGSARDLTVTAPERLAGAFELGSVDGSLERLGTDGLAVSADQAADHGWRTGSRTTLTFADGAERAFTVRAVYRDNELLGGYVITREAWAPHRTQSADRLLAVTLKDGVDPAEGTAAVRAVAADFGNPQVQTREEYASGAAEPIDMMLTLVYALLALAVLIALLGITNTLTLAVHERIRELGLLRAVGQTRPQVRAMVRGESALVAAFGTTGGLLLGGFLGWALVRAADPQGTGAFDLPVGRLAVIAVVGAVAGVAAGWRPARRASRLAILRAVATA